MYLLPSYFAFLALALFSISSLSSPDLLRGDDDAFEALFSEESSPFEDAVQLRSVPVSSKPENVRSLSSPFHLAIIEDDEEPNLLMVPFVAPGRRDHNQVRLHRPELKHLQVIRRESPFFRPMNIAKERRQSLRAAFRIESKEYARRYFKHRLPRQRSALPKPNASTPCQRNNRRRLMASNRRNGRSKATDPYKWTVTFSEDGSARYERAGVGSCRRCGRRKPHRHSKDPPKAAISYSKRHKSRRRRNQVGKPVVKVDNNRMHDELSDHYRGQHSPPFYNALSSDSWSITSGDKHLGRHRFRHLRKRKAAELLSDPVIRLAVSVSLGALVTCIIYALAAFICFLFPSFFGSFSGSDGDVSEDEKLLHQSGRPVRCVPVPVVPKEVSQVETVMV